MIGKLKSGNSVSYAIQGRLGDQPVKIEATQELAAPEMDNFFLVGVFEQWKNGKDQPALVSTDRALTYAYQQSQLVRADLHDKAEWAMGRNNWEAAKNLFEQAKKLDANDAEADGGLKIIEQLRSGALKKETLADDLKRQNQAFSEVVAKRFNQQPPAAPKASGAQPPVPVPAPTARSRIRSGASRSKEQRFPKSLRSRGNKHARFCRQIRTPLTTSSNGPTLPSATIPIWAIACVNL